MQKDKRALSWQLVVGVILFVSLFTALLIRLIYFEGDAKHIDARWIYVAGRCWLDGLSPYHEQTFYDMWEKIFSLSNDGRPFVYPPAIALIAIPMALFSWEAGALFFDLISAAVLLGSLFLIALLIRDNSSYTFHSLRLWSGLSLACSVSMISAAIYTGQTPLFAFFGCLMALYATDKRMPWLAAVAILIASIKPQLALVPLCLVALKHFRYLLYGALLTALFCFAIFLISYEENWIVHFIQSLEVNAKLPENAYSRLTAIYRLLDYRNISEWRIGVALLGPLLLLVAWIRYRPLTHTLLNLLFICLAFALTAVFSPLHNYDLCILAVCVACVPCFGWCWMAVYAPGVILVTRPSVVLLLGVKLLGWPSEWIGNEAVAGNLLNVGAVWMLVVYLWHVAVAKRL